MFIEELEIELCKIYRLLRENWASLVAQTVKNPPALWKTCVLSLGWDDPQRRA